MANLGYLQVVRHCNHFCGFCSNPTTPYVHTLESMKVLVDALGAGGYFGVMSTGGAPTLHPRLPAIAGSAQRRRLHVGMTRNGWRLADPDYAGAISDPGVADAAVSVYSVRAAVE